MAPKKSVYSSVVSRQIEEDIHVPFHLVGTKEWLDGSIYPGACKKLPITIVNRRKDVLPIRMALEIEPILGVDSETGGDNKRDGLDPLSETSRMLLFQLGTPKMVYLIEPSLVPFFKETLENPNILKVGQNIIHDFKFSSLKAGVTLVKHHYDTKKDTCVPEAYDTMLAEQILTAGLFGVQVGLEELSEKYPPHRLISKEVRKEFIDMRGQLEYRHLYYAARDVYLLFDIMEGQKKAIKKYDGMWDRVMLEMCAIYGTADAELTGFDINERVIQLVLYYQQRRAEAIRKRVTEIFNEHLTEKGKKSKFVIPDQIEYFNLDSHSAKLAALKKMGFDLKDVKRETLLELDSEITNLLSKYTECTKVISTYGEGLLGRRRLDGRVHPEFHQLGSGDIESRKGKTKATTIATGRWSSDAQQFPRPEHVLEPVDDNEASYVQQLFKDKYDQAIKKFQE